MYLYTCTQIYLFCLCKRQTTSTATKCNTLQHSLVQHTATHTTHCNTLNTLQHSAGIRRPATHCNTRQHTATHGNTRQHTAAHCCTRQHTATHCNSLQHTAKLGNALQHTATYCNTLHPTCSSAHDGIGKIPHSIFSAKEPYI